MEVFGAAFTPPTDFAMDEGWISVVAPPSSDRVRPNLLLHRRQARTGATLEILCGEIVAELKGSVKGLRDIVLDPFTFQDGTEGLLITFDCEVFGLSARQLQALRLDGELLTSLALTIPPQAFDDPGQKRSYLACLASMRQERTSP